MRRSNCTFAALFARLKPKRGPKRGAGRGICAVAAEMLRTIYHTLKDGTFYEERPRHRQAAHQHEAKRLLRRLDRLGFTAEISRALRLDGLVSCQTQRV